MPQCSLLTTYLHNQDLHPHERIPPRQTYTNRGSSVDLIDRRIFGLVLSGCVADNETQNHSGQDLPLSASRECENQDLTKKAFERLQDVIESDVYAYRVW